MNARNKFFLGVGIFVLVMVAGLVLFGKIKFQKTPSLPGPAMQQTSKLEKEIQQRLSSSASNDSDLDGLSNSEEKNYGTDPNNPDTDADGLMDADEIQIYKTDPKKYDTFNIGQSDGWAVKRNIIKKGGQIQRESLNALLKK